MNNYRKHDSCENCKYSFTLEGDDYYCIKDCPKTDYSQNQHNSPGYGNKMELYLEIDFHKIPNQPKIKPDYICDDFERVS